MVTSASATFDLSRSQMIEHAQCALAGPIASGERALHEVDRLLNRIFERLTSRHAGGDCGR